MTISDDTKNAQLAGLLMAIRKQAANGSQAYLCISLRKTHNNIWETHCTLTGWYCGTGVGTG